MDCNSSVSLLKHKYAYNYPWRKLRLWQSFKKKLYKEKIFSVAIHEVKIQTVIFQVYNLNQTIRFDQMWSMRFIFGPILFHKFWREDEIWESFGTLSGLFDIREIYENLKEAQETDDDNSLLFIQIFTLVAAVFNILVLFLEFIGMILICRGVSGYNDCSCCCTCCIGENQVNVQGNLKNFVNYIFYISY